MCNHFILMRNVIVLAVSVLLLFTGCEKQAEAPTKKKVVSKKIDVPGKKAAPAKAPVKKPMPAKKEVAEAPKQAGAEKAAGEKKAGTAPDAIASIAEKTGALAYAYEPVGKIDPFVTIFQKREEAEAEKAKQRKKKKRVPLTPLEKIALSQLKLVAVMLAPSGHRALVEEASGKGYIITNGTYIGTNSGRVINILIDKVVVEEEVEDVLGKLVIRKTEMKLQKTPGE